MNSNTPGDEDKSSLSPHESEEVVADLGEIDTGFSPLPEPSPAQTTTATAAQPTPETPAVVAAAITAAAPVVTEPGLTSKESEELRKIKEKLSAETEAMRAKLATQAKSHAALTGSHEPRPAGTTETEPVKTIVLTPVPPAEPEKPRTEAPRREAASPVHSDEPKAGWLKTQWSRLKSLITRVRQWTPLRFVMKTCMWIILVILFVVAAVHVVEIARMRNFASLDSLPFIGKKDGVSAPPVTESAPPATEAANPALGTSPAPSKILASVLTNTAARVAVAGDLKIGDVLNSSNVNYNITIVNGDVHGEYPKRQVTQSPVPSEPVVYAPVIPPPSVIKVFPRDFVPDREVELKAAECGVTVHVPPGQYWRFIRPSGWYLKPSTWAPVGSFEIEINGTRLEANSPDIPDLQYFGFWNQGTHEAKIGFEFHELETSKPKKRGFFGRIFRRD